MRFCIKFKLEIRATSTVKRAQREKKIRETEKQQQRNLTAYTLCVMCYSVCGGGHYYSIMANATKCTLTHPNGHVIHYLVIYESHALIREATNCAY